MCRICQLGGIVLFCLAICMLTILEIKLGALIVAEVALTTSLLILSIWLIFYEK